MFKLSFTQTALDYIHGQLDSSINNVDLEKLVLAVFFFSSGTWSTSFCGNMIELVEKHKVMDGYPEFVEWKEFERQPAIEVYIEKAVVPDMQFHETILIDAFVGQTYGDEAIGMLFMKRQDTSSYGMVI